MKIAYSAKAHFLQEGIQALTAIGIEIIPLELSNEVSFEDSINATCPDADLVIVELFGNHFIPTDIAHAKMPTLAYGVDSTINLYLYKHLFQLFDYVFVDQEKAAKDLNKNFIPAKYLPLSIDNELFREFNPNPEHEVTFVGRFSRSRKKRANLIKYLEHNTSLTLIEDIKLNEMQDIFANSQICLNENLFNGFTYRVLQSFAAGSLLFNEENMNGVDNFFKPFEHYIPYSHENILDLINQVKENPAKYQEMAKNAQELCKSFHTSTYRVKEMFATILDCKPEEAYSSLENKIQNKEQIFHKLGDKHNFVPLYKKSAPNYITFSQIMYELNYVQVFGGHVTPIFTKLLNLTQQQDMISFIAMPVLLRLFACTNQQKFFDDLYVNASKLYPQLTENAKAKDLLYLQHFPTHAHIDFACVCASYFILQKCYAEAEINLSQIMHLLKDDFAFLPFSNDNNNKDLTPENQKEVELNFKIAQIYSCIDNVFELGFEKINDPAIPDTGLKAAWNAWLMSYNTNILDFILEKSKEYEIAGGLLDGFLVAYKQGFVTDTQKDIIKDIAKEYYIELH